MFACQALPSVLEISGRLRQPERLLWLPKEKQRITQPKTAPNSLVGFLFSMSGSTLKFAAVGQFPVFCLNFCELLLQKIV